MDRLALRRVRARRGAQDQGGEGRRHGHRGLVSATSAAKTGLRECLARGADEAIWIDSTGDSRTLDALGDGQGARRGRPGAAPTTSSGSARRAWAPTSRSSARCSPSSLDLPHVGQRHQARGRRREDHRAPRDRGRARGRRVPAAGRADRAEGPERAALRVAQGDHGGQEEADRREEARGARRPGGGSGAGAKIRWRKLELPPPRQAVQARCPADDPAAAGEGARRDCCGKRRRSSEP